MPSADSHSDHGSPREHYIPLRPAELVQRLADDPAVTIFEREEFKQLCQLLEATIHHDYHSRLEELKAAYGPFDPDCDATRQYERSPEERKALCQRLFARFDDLLGRANYRRLSRAELEEAVQTPNADGLALHIDLSIFERLEIYVRGENRLPRTARSWRTLWRGRERQVPAYRRLAIIFRLKHQTPLTDPLDTRAVVLKLFKDVPKMDVETLLPGTDVRIGWFEQAQIILPTLSGVGLTLMKLLQGAAAVAFVSLAGLLAFLVLISGAIGYGMRSFYSYLRTREKYQLSLTRSLYFQNLDNNAGVLFHLLNEAEEQEFREVVLAWWLLWRGGLQQARDHEIDAAAEAWLHARCAVAVDFEVGDALAKLHRLGLAQVSATGRWRAVSIGEALASLDRAWDEQFAYHRPEEASPTEPVMRPRIWRRAA